MYIGSACRANGTMELDFLAEQECLCGCAFWEAIEGCNNCYFAHGYQENTPAELSSSRTSLSIAECSPSLLYQPFSNLLPRVNITSYKDSPPITLGTDRFPNNTVV
jgi:hypothetical protein